MNPDTVIRLLQMALRVLETWLKRRAPTEAAAPSRADQMVAQVAPLADKLLDRIAPASRASTSASPRKIARRSNAGAALLQSVLLSALVSGGAAYVVLQQQRRLQERHRFLQAAWPEELLEVLSAPGGGGRLVFSGTSLIDPETGAVYPVVDGIPDFISTVADEALPATLPAAPELRASLLELLEPLQQNVLGAQRLGNAAFAGAVAAMARTGWVLSAPGGAGDYELDMARTNPAARILSISPDWEALLETRRRARRAGLSNVYCVRGDVTLLPVRGGTMDGVWSAETTRRVAAPERVLTQLARVAKPGATVVGAALVAGHVPPLEQWLAIPAQPNPANYLALLAASGLREARSFREGSYLRFFCVRA